MICPQCKQDNDDDAQFCNYCSYKLDLSPPAPAVPPKKGNPVIWILGIGILCLGIVFFILPAFSAPDNDCSVQEGSLTVQNVPNSAVLVTLMDTRDITVKSLYLNAGAQGDIENICNGRYYVYYEFGQGWDPASQKFSVVTGGGHFVDPLDIQGDSHWDASLIPGSGNSRTAVDHVDNSTNS